MHMTSQAYQDSVLVDGLIVANWSEDVFSRMRGAGVTAANCTICIWENFEETLANVAQFQRFFRDHADLIRPVHTTEDIHAAKREGRTGIILGWQNISAIEDKIERLELFHTLGVRIIQIAYNSQNLVGTGCYESRDSGLSDFGREALAEMNRLGLVVDLSHVGPRTTHDAITASTAPVVFSHVGAASQKEHPRNKTDEEMRMVAERGGLVGMTPFPWFLPGDGDATIEDFVTTMEHVVDVVGEDHIAVGTDFVDGHGGGFLEWIMRDKGYARPFPAQPLDEVVSSFAMPPGIEDISQWPNLWDALDRRGWSQGRITKALGENWVRVLRDIWGS